MTMSSMKMKLMLMTPMTNALGIEAFAAVYYYQNRSLDNFVAIVDDCYDDDDVGGGCDGDVVDDGDMGLDVVVVDDDFDGRVVDFQFVALKLSLFKK